MFVHDGVAWGAPSTTRFVYHGWNLLTEYSVSGSTLTLQRKNSWGLDLAGVHGGSGALDSAGGIGGLLATLDTQGTTTTTDDKKYVYFYDANGNVGQAVDTATTTSVTIAARYEYDAYGVNLLDTATLAQSGPYAAKNPFRFSTKWFDDETTLGYWGYRYYLPSIGRWVSRDPETDEAYRAFGGVPVSRVDYYGLCAKDESVNRLGPLVEPRHVEPSCLTFCSDGIQIPIDDCMRMCRIKLRGNRGCDDVCRGLGHHDRHPCGSICRRLESRYAHSLPLDSSDGCTFEFLTDPGASLLCGAAAAAVNPKDEANSRVRGLIILHFRCVDDCFLDALQHCIGAASLAQRIGRWCACSVDYWQEIVQGDGGVMDHINNEQGIRYCSHATNPSHCCWELWQQGLLSTDGDCK